MRKILTPTVHGLVDYVFVIFLLLSPTIFHLGDLPAMLAYALGVVHLLLTILTDFQLGIIKIIPFRIHGIIELIVSIILIPLPWIVGFADNEIAKYFFIGLGLTVFLTWLITDYNAKGKI